MIEKLLSTNQIPYKLIDEDRGLKLVKVNSNIHILYLYGKGTKFLMGRDFFDYLDGNTIPYAILCHDTLSNNLYYLKLNKKANWLKSCFETCDKDEIYLGKNVLNSRMTKDEIIKEIRNTKSRENTK